MWRLLTHAANRSTPDVIVFIVVLVAAEGWKIKFVFFQKVRTRRSCMIDSPNFIRIIIPVTVW